MPSATRADVIRAVQSAVSCRRCGGARALVTTPERFRLASRAVDPTRDCVCPIAGGPVYERLRASAFARSWPIKTQPAVWSWVDRDPRRVPFWVGREGWREVDLVTWRAFLATNWDALLAGTGAIRCVEGVPC